MTELIDLAVDALPNQVLGPGTYFLCPSSDHRCSCSLGIFRLQLHCTAELSDTLWEMTDVVYMLNDFASLH